MKSFEHHLKVVAIISFVFLAVSGVSAQCCFQPENESTEVVARFFVTVTAFRQTVSDSTGHNLNGLTVKETSGYAGTNECYYSGAPFPPTSTVTGGTWTIGSADQIGLASIGTNQWGTDLDGDSASIIAAIRQHHSLPCTDHVPQTMLSASTCNPIPIYPYYWNTQTVTINPDSIVNCRAGKCDTIAY